MRKELWVRAMNRLSPINGRAILRRFGIPNETPVSWRVFPKFGKCHIAINDRRGAALIGSRLRFRPDDPYYGLSDRDRCRVDKTWRLVSSRKQVCPITDQRNRGRLLVVDSLENQKSPSIS